MATREDIAAVSAGDSMHPPPELDDSTDFFDNDRLQETFSSGALDFDEWTLLISEIETSFPADIKKLCLVYDAFLLEFPLCHGYWKRYAYHKIQLCTLEAAAEVFKRAIQAATYSVPVWLDYCAFAVAAYEDPHDVSRLFERGLSFVGKDYSCFTLWDKYIEFLLGQKQWSSLAHVYLRTLKHPSKKLHLYYENFKKIAASLKENIKCRIDVNGDLSSDPMEKDLVPTHHTDEEISIVIRDLMGPSSRSSVSKALHAYLSVGEQFYQDSRQLMEKISCFEKHICRSYFHVNLLDTNQLDNWHAYLSFGETSGDFDWAIKLYERCLIPCANHAEFWLRYVDFVESKGGKELANFALARASQTFIKDASVIHQFNERFKEHVADASGTSVARCQCNEELGFGFVESVTKKANMEKRLGNFEAAVTTYREALKKTLTGKENFETTALLYVKFSRLKYMITNSADEAAQILIEGNEKVPHCKSLLEELIRFLMMHGGSRQVDLLDPIVDKEISHRADSSDGLSAEDKEEISNLYMEFIDLSGTVHDVRKALDRHIKLFPLSARAKLHGSRPSGKSFRELIQRRKKSRECYHQNLFTNKDISSTVDSPPVEKKELPLDSEGAQSKDVVQADCVNTEPKQEFLASRHLVGGNINVSGRENLCESQSNLSIGIKADESCESSREVSLPIQATPEHGSVTKQAHFSSNSIDSVKSDAIVIQPSGSRSPQRYQSQELLRQTGQNRYHSRDLNQTHRDSKPHSHEKSPQMSYSPVRTGQEILGQHMSVAPRDNSAGLQSSISQNLLNESQNSASQMHPMVQTSNAYPQTQILSQHMFLSPPDSQNPQNQYHGSASQVKTSFADTQTQIPVQSNHQQVDPMQSNKAYNQMWHQYYYYYYYNYYQQQQQLLSEQPQPNQNSQPQPNQNFQPQPNQNSQPQPNQNSQPQPNQNSQPQPNQNSQPQPNQNSQPQPNQTSQPQLDQNLMGLLSRQYQSQAKTQYPPSQQVEQLNTQQQSQEPQYQQQIQFQQQQQQQRFQWQQQQQQHYLLYLQQQQLQGGAEEEKQKLPMPEVSTKDCNIQKSQESEAANEEAVSSDSDTSISSI